MAVTIAQFLQRLEASGILSDADLVAVKGASAGQDDAGDAEPLVKRLHKEGRITTYQAQALWKGKGQQLALGNYIIEDELGRGGMGVVLKARHKRMLRQVAIKVLPAAMVKDAAAIARFQREVVAAAKLTHSNIVAAFDADEINGQHILVMEFVNGRDLSSLVKKQGPLPVPQAIDYVVQAARGLEFAHKQGVIHRDIKPANLLLDATGTVKILDMGLARLSGTADVANQAELTGTGTVMGTVDYMSPEQALSTKTADHRADIYSLGISLFYLVTGNPAYTGDSLMARLMAHANSPIPSLKSVRPDISPQLQGVFERMVAKKVEDRYQSMTEVIAALETCRNDVTATATVARPVVQQAQESFDKLSQFLRQSNESEASESTSAATVAVDGGQSAATDAAEATLTMQSNERTAPTLPPRTQTGVKKQPQRSAKSLWKDWRVLSGTAAAVALMITALMMSRGSPEKPNPAANSQVAAAKTGSGSAKASSSTSVTTQSTTLAADRRRTLDLLPLIDPSKDKVTGTWERKGVDLIGKGPGIAVCEVPYQPADEYDVLAEFATLETGDVSLYLSRGGHSFKWAMAVQRNRFGFSLIDGLSVTTDPVTVKQSLVFEPGRKYTTRVEVRRDKLIGYLDDKKVTEVPVKYAQFSRDSFPVRDESLLGLRINNSGTTFHRLEVVEITGEGRRTRLVPAFSGAKPLSIAELLDSPDYVWTEPENLGPTVNGPADQSIRSVTNDELRLFFHRKGGADGKADELCEVIRTSRDAPFGEPRVVSTAPESYVSGDGLTLVNAGPDISMRQRPSLDAPFGEKVDLRLINSTATERRPTLSPNGLTLVFGSTRDNPQRTELWMSRRASQADAFGPPTKLGPQVNDGKTVFMGVMLADRETLLFLRNGRLHLTFRSPMGIQSASELRDHPFQGGRFGDLGVWIAPDGRTAYFSADRPGGLGGTDIYVTRRVPKLDVPSPSKGASPSIAFWKTSEFQPWFDRVQMMSAERQLQEVAGKLVELNPGFDGRLTGLFWQGKPTVENNSVTIVGLQTDHVADLSPLRALTQLKTLGLRGNSPEQARLTDLSPLTGLPLVSIHCVQAPVFDLSPLKGMPLKYANFSKTLISDLGPLTGMKLEKAIFQGTRVTNLAPLYKNTTLKTIELLGAPVAGAEVAALQRALPDCQITWDDPAKTPEKPTGPQPPPAVVYLDDLPEKSYVGFQNQFFKPNRNPESLANFNANFPGESPLHALIMHAPPKRDVPDMTASVVYDLSGNHDRFQSRVRVRSAGRDQPVIAEVWGDGKRLWESEDLVLKKAAGAALDVDVRGVRELKLIVRAERINAASHTLWIEPRLTAVAPQSTPLAAGGTPVDVLALIDPAKQSRVGAWKKENGVLVSSVPSGNQRSSLDLPVDAKAPYRLEMVVEKKAGSGILALFLPVAGRDVKLERRPNNAVLDAVDGVELDKQHTAAIEANRKFQSGMPVTFTVDVTPTSIRATIDGETLVDWNGKSESLSIKRGQEYEHVPGRLMLGSNNTVFRVRKLTYTPLGAGSPQAKVAAPSPAIP